MTKPDALVDKVLADIRSSLDDFDRRWPRRTLIGYALFTDDDLSSLGCLALSSEQPGAEDSDTLFSPTDWPFESQPPLFDASDAAIRAASGQHGHVRIAFEALVAALEKAKAAHLFPQGTYLSVLSTDPSELLDRLEDGSVKQLNDAELLEARRAFLTKWGCD